MKLTQTKLWIWPFYMDNAYLPCSAMLLGGKIHRPAWPDRLNFPNTIGSKSVSKKSLKLFLKIRVRLVIRGSVA